MWEQTWAVPGESIVVGAASLLPAGVTLSPDSSAFVTAVPQTDITASLGEMCASCAAADGTVMPKPAFHDTISTTISLANALVSASLIGEAFDVELAHDLSFDPLRPSSDTTAERGFILIEVTSDGTVVARDSISGDDRAFTASDTLMPTLAIQPVDVTNTLDVRLVVYSPAGDSAQMNASESMGLSLLPEDVLIGEATVEATAITVNAPAATIELAVDSALVSRVQSGELQLEVQNPFALEGTLDLAFDLGATTLRKTVELTTGTSSTVIGFTREQIQDLMGAGTVDVTAEGTLSSPDGTLTIAPADALVMESMFQIVVLSGGSEGES